MKPVFRREERAMEAAAGPAPDELERILLLSKQEEEQRKLQFKEKQKLELQQALLLSEEMFKLDLHPLEKFKWFKDQNTIKSINKDIILLIDDLIKKGNFLDEYEVNEDQILSGLFKNKRNFAYYRGPWKYPTLSHEFHNMAVYNSEIMLEHFKNGIIYSGIIDNNYKPKSKTYITPEQALEETKKYPIIFELNVVTMYIKLLLEQNQSQKIWTKLDSPKDKLLWFELQKLFDPFLNLLIKLLKLTISLPIFYDTEPEIMIDFNQESPLKDLRIKGSRYLKRNLFSRLSILIKDYVYPAVKYFILKLENGQVVVLYK